jgi:glycerol-3-phosphate acyltransferase PlsX
VVKSHGAADETGVSSAIKLAFDLAKTGFTEKLAARVAAAAAPVDTDNGDDNHGDPAP